jgi:hypothetical protein
MSAKKMTAAEKYEALKRHTERAGMVVTEKNGRIIVTKKPKK